MSEFKEKYQQVLEELKKERADNKELYEEVRDSLTQIRSSQIAALVGFLIKKGIIK